MNHCRRCDSDYEKPGTCNCFAPQHAQPLTAPQPSFVPYVPYVPSTTSPAPWTPTIWWGTHSGSAKYEGPPLTVWYKQ